MTLCVCIKGKDGMVLASDSRGTFGDPRAVTAQNDNMKKLYLVSKYVGVILAGSGELGAMVMNEISDKILVNQSANTPSSHYSLSSIRASNRNLCTLAFRFVPPALLLRATLPLG